MEFKKEKVYTPLVATPTHNVSQAIKYGNLVFVSGMVGEDENEVLMDGLEAQWDRYFLNMDVAPARYTVVAPTVAEPYLFEITCVAGV